MSRNEPNYANNFLTFMTAYDSIVHITIYDCITI